MRLINWILFLGMAVLSVSRAWATDARSPRASALGGAGHAAPLLNDAIYQNPAFISFLKSYSIHYHWNSLRESDPSPGRGELRGRSFHLSVQDGRSELFQAGLGYTQREDHRMIHLGASRSISQRVSAGLGLKGFLKTESFTLVAKDVSTSMAWITDQWIQTAFIVDNALEQPEGKDRGLYREITAAAKISWGQSLMIYLDPHYTPSLPVSSERLGIEGGLELAAMSDLFLRFGAFGNSVLPHQSGMRGSGWSMGLGWVAFPLSLDYAYVRGNRPFATFSHQLGATLFL